MNTQSQIENYFIKKSGYRDTYAPREKIRSVIVENFPGLGRLTALRFLEWVQQHPGEVISLPTGKTPEHFIKWVTHYLVKWNQTEIIRELEAVGLEPKVKPDMQSLHFVQMDEFYPIDSSQHNSFCNYVKKYYIDGFGLDPAKALVIDCNEIGLHENETLKEIWTDGIVDLSLRDRKPLTIMERRQKEVLLNVDNWCLEYECNIDQLGGIGFFLGGIGPDGHIAFNTRGSSHDSITRLMETNYETQAAAAGDLGGIEVSGKLPVITIGLETITQNPDATIIIISAGEAKSKVVADAIQEEASLAYPASAIRKSSNAVFYLTRGSAMLLSERKVVDLRGNNEVSIAEMERAVIDLSLQLNRPIMELSDEDFTADRTCSILMEKQSGLQPGIVREQVFQSLAGKLEKGADNRSHQSFLHTEPHHDDIMLGYLPGLVRDLHDQSTTHAFATLTSGFTAVTNDCILERVKHTLDLLKNKKDYFDSDPNKEIDLFVTGLAGRDNSKVKFAEARRFLRCLAEVFETREISVLKQKAEWLEDYLQQAYPGQKDIKEVQLLKGMMREWEAETLWGVFGIRQQDVRHLRLGFYQGDIFNEEPTKSRDLPPIYDLLKEIKPNVLSVAFDPEASGPDTHYKVLQAIAEALRQLKAENLPIPGKIWGYRNVWYRFHPADATMFMSVSQDELASAHSLFMDVFVTQRKASFPSHEYDGPFSELARQIQVEQYQKMVTCLGKQWFLEHEQVRIRAAKALVYLKEMDIDEFLSHARELKEKIEN